MFTTSIRKNIHNLDKELLLELYGYSESLVTILKFSLIISTFIFIFTLGRYIIYHYYDYLLAKPHIRCFFSKKYLTLKDKKSSTLSKEEQKIVDKLKIFKYIFLIIQIILLLSALCMYARNVLIMSLMEEFYFDNLRNLKYLKRDMAKITELRYEIAKFVELRSINDQYTNLESLRKDIDRENELYNFFLEYDRLKKTSVIMLVITISFLCYKKFF